MDSSNYSKRTKGEEQVEQLLNQLSKSADYYFVSEAVVTTKMGALRPDFVVACWNKGVVVIEVKDWLEFLDGSDYATVHIKRQDGRKFSLENPEVTARNYATSLASLFKEDPTLLEKFSNGREGLCFPWHYIVIFPNMRQAYLDVLVRQRVFTKGIPFGVESLKSKGAFQNMLENLPWQLTLRNPLTEAQRTSVRRIIKPSLAVNESGTLSPLQEMLSEEAVSIAEDTTYRLVRGIAGSGKSLVLERRAKYLREHHSELKLLVMAFNEQLEKNLRYRIDEDEVDVHTFHAMCAKIVREANRKWRTPNDMRGWLQHHWGDFIEEQEMSINFVADEIAWRKDVNLFDNAKYLKKERSGRGSPLGEDKRLVINQIFDDYRKHQDTLRIKNQLWEDWHDVPALAMSALTDKYNHPLHKHYDVILLDEAQDFAPTWMAVVKELLRDGGTLFICDDPTQSLFRQFSWKQKGIEVRGRTRILRIPFRSTREINVAAHALIEADPLLGNSSDITKPILDSAEIQTGKVPYLASCSDKNKETQFVENEIIRMCDSGIAANEIAVLCHNHNDVKRWAGLRNQGITVMSFDKMKGLEYRIVFLPGLESAFTQTQNQEKDMHFVKECRQRIFTGMTRARQMLILSHIANLPSELEPVLPYIYREYL